MLWGETGNTKYPRIGLFIPLHRHFEVSFSMGEEEQDVVWEEFRSYIRRDQEALKKTFLFKITKRRYKETPTTNETKRSEKTKRICA